MCTFRTLTAREIECRVAQIAKDGNGLTLLLYKDARCDMAILDETVGAMNWQRTHARENANCIVSIWDAEKGQWIAKEDTGTESNTEAEKGLASDSFKRACVNWGIGRELYTAPRIWINKGAGCSINENGRGGYACYDRFDVAEIAYNEHREICRLKIINAKSRTTVFDWNDGSGNKIEDLQSLAQPESPAGPKMATQAQREIILETLKAKASEAKLADAYRKYGPHLERMTAEDAGITLQAFR